MFNLQGSEIIFILLIALVVLGPEKLPGAIRRATKTYAEFRKMANGFQSEFRSAIDEPLREMRETADIIKDSADPKKFAEQAERDAAAAARIASDDDGDDGGGLEVLSSTLTPAESVADDEADDAWADPVDPVDESTTSTPSGAPPLAAVVNRVEDSDDEDRVDEDRDAEDRDAEDDEADGYEEASA